MDVKKQSGGCTKVLKLMHELAIRKENKMSKEKKIEVISFAILQSAFGDYWVGKTLRKSNGKTIFPTFEVATERATALTDSISNQDELEDVNEEDTELVNDELLDKWGIKNG